MSRQFLSMKLELSRKRLLLYLEAEQAILSGQEYEIEGLKLTRADLKVVRDTIANLEYEVNQYDDMLKPVKRARTRVIVPQEAFKL